jgi:hypothetical protein
MPFEGYPVDRIVAPDARWLTGVWIGMVMSTFAMSAALLGASAAVGAAVIKPRLMSQDEQF